MGSGDDSECSGMLGGNSEDSGVLGGYSEGSVDSVVTWWTLGDSVLECERRGNSLGGSLFYSGGGALSLCCVYYKIYI